MRSDEWKVVRGIADEISMDQWGRPLSILKARTSRGFFYFKINYFNKRINFSLSPSVTPYVGAR